MALVAVEALLAALGLCLQDAAAGFEGGETADPSPALDPCAALLAPPGRPLDVVTGVGAVDAVDPSLGSESCPAFGNGCATPGPGDVPEETTEVSVLSAT